MAKSANRLNGFFKENRSFAPSNSKFENTYPINWRFSSIIELSKRSYECEASVIRALKAILNGTGSARSILMGINDLTRALYTDTVNLGIGRDSPTQKLDVNGYVRGATGLCIGSACRSVWPTSFVASYIVKRSAVQTKDSVVYCPSTHPLVVSCYIADDQAPASGPTSLAGYCDGDGLCHAGGTAPSQFRRQSLGTDNVYLERVINSAGVEGCWQYDNAHSHSDYRIELTCVMKDPVGIL